MVRGIGATRPLGPAFCYMEPSSNLFQGRHLGGLGQAARSLPRPLRQPCARHCRRNWATRGNVSAAFETLALDGDERVFQPRGRKIIGHDLLDRLEHLEVMARVGVRPERDHGLQRRTTRQRAGNLGDQDRGVFWKLEARSRPFLHPIQGLQIFGTLVEGPQHLGRYLGRYLGCSRHRHRSWPRRPSRPGLIRSTRRGRAQAARKITLDRSGVGPRLPATSINGGFSVMERVLAAVRVGPSKTEIREYPMPDVPDDAALMKMEVAGICGTDVKLYKTPPTKSPVIMGHENIGTIAKAGREFTRRKGFKEGDLVFVEHYVACG